MKQFLGWLLGLLFATLNWGYDLLCLGKSLAAALEAPSDNAQPARSDVQLWEAHEHDLKAAAAAAAELWKLS